MVERFAYHDGTVIHITSEAKCTARHIIPGRGIQKVDCKMVHGIPGSWHTESKVCSMTSQGLVCSEGVCIVYSTILMRARCWEGGLGTLSQTLGLGKQGKNMSMVH